MRPLDTDRKSASGIASEEQAVLSGVHRTISVFPNRFIRKTKAYFGALAGRGTALLLCAAVMVSGTAFGALKFSGSDNAYSSGSVLSAVSLPIRSLIVNGNSEIDLKGVEFSLAPSLQGSMFTFDTEGARETLLENPWFKSAFVRKVYPDTIAIDVVERQPFAFWKSSDTITVIARDGVVLGEASPEHLKFPQVVGLGANLVASDFISVVSRFPEISRRASGFVRVAHRRWDVVLRNGLKVQLPEQGWKDALAELDSLQKRKGVLDREIVQIDMRLPDRLVLRLQKEVAEERRERLENVLKRSWHRT